MRESAGQLALRWDATSGEARGAWHALREALRQVVDRVGLKEVSFRLDESASFISHALSEKNRNHELKLKHLPALLELDGDDTILKALAGLVGREVVAAAPPEPEDMLLALLEIMTENLGLDLRAGLLAKARTRAATRRRPTK